MSNLLVNTFLSMYSLLIIGVVCIQVVALVIIHHPVIVTLSILTLLYIFRSK